MYILDVPTRKSETVHYARVFLNEDKKKKKHLNEPVTQVDLRSFFFPTNERKFPD